MGATGRQWESLGDELARRGHAAFASELFLACRPVLTVVLTEASPKARRTSAPPPAVGEPGPAAPVIDDFPPVVHCHWIRDKRGAVTLMRGSGDRARHGSLVLGDADAQFARRRWLGTLLRHPYPAAYARSFEVVLHQRDMHELPARVAAARAAVEKDLRELATGLVARKLLPASRAEPPPLQLQLVDERSEATRTRHPAPRLE